MSHFGKRLALTSRLSASRLQLSSCAPLPRVEPPLAREEIPQHHQRSDDNLGKHVPLVAGNQAVETTGGRPTSSVSATMKPKSMTNAMTPTTLNLRNYCTSRLTFIPYHRLALALVPDAPALIEAHDVKLPLTAVTLYDGVQD